MLLFHSIAPHIQLQLLEKLSATEYVKFLQTSVDAFYISQQIKNRVELKLDQLFVENSGEGIALRLKGGTKCVSFENMNMTFKSTCLGINAELSDDLLSNLIRILKTTKSSTKMLEMHAPVTCSPSLFEHFIMVSNTTGLKTVNELELVYISLPIVQKLPQLEVRCGITDEMVLKIQARHMVFEQTMVTSAGLNSLLKDWFYGKRIIRHLKISHSYGIMRPYIAERILDDLDFSRRTDFMSGRRASEEHTYLLNREDETLEFTIWRSSIFAQLM